MTESVQGTDQEQASAIDPVQAHQALCETTGAAACLIIHHGVVIQDWHGPGYTRPMYAQSSTKSITAILVGMLADDGKITSLDERVCSYIQEWCDGVRGEVTLRHLLTMTSGLSRIMDNRAAGYAADKDAAVIALTPDKRPGTVWDYSNEAVQLLSPVLDKAAGEPIQEYARKRLFEPLGMKDTRLHLDDQGHAWTYADMETTPEDMAKIGLLMLNGGQWEGKQVVSRDWIGRSTSPSQSLNDQYGFLWWLYESPQGFAALGNLDTNLYIFPKLDMVVVRMQNYPGKQRPEGIYEPKALPLIEQIAAAGE
ncbi:MAG TPA: serine hydrolase [Symbiobacteriaceae bacterium]|jgi:CubicO group peptidase (beta-lactamase class C family)